MLSIAERPEDLAQRAEAGGYATEGTDHAVTLEAIDAQWRIHFLAAVLVRFPGTMSRIEQTGALRQVFFKAEASL